jgi:hypothetical protein
MCRVIEKELYMVFQMLLCGESYENVYFKGIKLSIIEHVERWIWNTVVNIFLKHPTLPVKVTLNCNYTR